MGFARWGFRKLAVAFGKLFIANPDLPEIDDKLIEIISLARQLPDPLALVGEGFFRFPLAPLALVDEGEAAVGVARRPGECAADPELDVAGNLLAEALVAWADPRLRTAELSRRR